MSDTKQAGLLIISSQRGDSSRETNIFSQARIKLNELSDKYMTDKYFATIKELSIIFRISGNSVDFESEGPERMRYQKKDCYITIDLVFPEMSWKGFSSKTVKKLIRDRVEECLELLIERAEKAKESTNPEGLRRDIDKVLSVFMEDELSI